MFLCFSSTFFFKYELNLCVPQKKTPTRKSVWMENNRKFILWEWKGPAQTLFDCCWATENETNACLENECLDECTAFVHSQKHTHTHYAVEKNVNLLWMNSVACVRQPAITASECHVQHVMRHRAAQVIVDAITSERCEQVLWFCFVYIQMFRQQLNRWLSLFRTR